MKRTVFALVIAAFCLAAAPAHAEWVWVNRPYNPYARRHFYLGAQPAGVVVLHETGPRAFLDHGGGVRLFLGGRLSRIFALEFAWEPTFHNNEVDIFGRPIGTIGLEALTVDAKFYPLHRRVQPYISVGAGAYLLGDNLSVFAAGPGYQVGGGVDFWLSPHFSLGLKTQYRGVGLVDYDVYRDNTYLSLLTFGVDFTGRF
jgi:Outer membrane protein beta-barrel domain